MKKTIITILCCVLLLSMTGCKKEEFKEDDVALYPGRDILPGEANYYYTFTGKANNISFKTGIADYRDDKAEFKLEDIEVNPKLNYGYGTITVYFNGKHFGETTFFKSDVKDNKIEVGLSAIGKKIKRDKDGNFYGEFDSFMETDPKDFANAIKVEFSYTKGKSDNLIKEELTLDIEKHD